MLCHWRSIMSGPRDHVLSLPFATCVECCSMACQTETMKHTMSSDVHIRGVFQNIIRLINSCFWFCKWSILYSVETRRVNLSKVLLEALGPWRSVSIYKMPTLERRWIDCFYPFYCMTQSRSWSNRTTLGNPRELPRLNHDRRPSEHPK